MLIGNFSDCHCFLNVIEVEELKSRLIIKVETGFFIAMILHFSMKVLLYVFSIYSQMFIVQSNNCHRRLRGNMGIYN